MSTTVRSLSHLVEKLLDGAGLGRRNIAPWQWRVLLVLTSINLLNYFDRLLLVPMFPTLKSQLHISDFKLGLLASAVLLVDCLTALPAGYWSDRGPRRKIMAGGVFVWSAATFASGIAPGYGALLTARAAVGVGEGAYGPGGTAIITASFPERLRARVQSVYNLGMIVGGIMGLAAGGLLAEWIGWRHSFMIVGLPGVLLGIAIYRLQVRDPRASKEAHVAWNLLRIPAYAAVLAGGLFASFASAAFVIWSPAFVTRYHHLSIVKASGWLALLVLLSSAIGVLLGGYMADRLHEHWAWGRIVTVGAGILIATPFLYITVETESLLTLYACVFMATATLAWYQGPITAVIHDLTPSQAHAFAFGLYMFVIYFFGDAIAPAAVGFLSDRSNLRHSLLFGVAANFISALCFLVAAWLVARRTASRSSR